MPPWLATLLQASPTVHFVAFAQAILYRGAGLDAVWTRIAVVSAIGAVFVAAAILRFRKVTALS